MVTALELEEARQRAREYLHKAGIVLTPEEAGNIEVADFGLGKLQQIGLELVVYVNTERCCAKELVLFPGQICPEHRHPTLPDGTPGKEETFRCRWGHVTLHVAHEPGPNPKGWTTVRLDPGQQFTIWPDTLHWFQGGPQGAVVSEFSTRSTDEYDIFTDPAIRRATVVS